MLFKDKIEDQSKRDEIIVYPTCALDEDVMKTVFTHMKDKIFMNRMVESNIRV